MDFHLSQWHDAGLQSEKPMIFCIATIYAAEYTTVCVWSEPILSKQNLAQIKQIGEAYFSLLLL